MLRKCLDKKTQNESLNGMIWNKLPKSTILNATVLELGVYDAVAHFNTGLGASMSILTE